VVTAGHRMSVLHVWRRDSVFEKQLILEQASEPGASVRCGLYSWAEGERALICSQRQDFVPTTSVRFRAQKDRDRVACI
jgi:hypothetical protein